MAPIKEQNAGLGKGQPPKQRRQQLSGSATTGDEQLTRQTQLPTGALDIRLATQGRHQPIGPSHTIEDEEDESEENGEYDDQWPPRIRSSAIPYVGYPGNNQPLSPGIYQGRNGSHVQVHAPIRIPQQRRTALNAPQQQVDYDVATQRTSPRRTHTGNEEEAQPQPRARKQKPARRGPHWLFILGLGALGMVLLWIVLSMVGTWWTNWQTDTTYGRPRTYQFDAVVGHNDSPTNPTHFILINLNRHVEIIEFPGGDTTHARIYIGPTLYGDGGDLIPVTGKVFDVNGDGKPDVILYIQTQRIVFLNEGTQFKPLPPDQQNTIHLPPQ